MSQSLRLLISAKVPFYEAFPFQFLFWGNILKTFFNVALIKQRSNKPGPMWGGGAKCVAVISWWAIGEKFRRTELSGVKTNAKERSEREKEPHPGLASIQLSGSRCCCCNRLAITLSSAGHKGRKEARDGRGSREWAAGLSQSAGGRSQWVFLKPQQVFGLNEPTKGMNVWCRHAAKVYFFSIHSRDCWNKTDICIVKLNVPSEASTRWAEGVWRVINTLPLKKIKPKISITIMMVSINCSSLFPSRFFSVPFLGFILLLLGHQGYYYWLLIENSRLFAHICVLVRS